MRSLVVVCRWFGWAGLALSLLVLGSAFPVLHAVPNYVDTIERPLRYRPDGTDFVIENGTEFFNRPLYGVPTAFRVDGGDRPEFVLYLPGRGGNVRLALLTPAGATWLHEAAHIETRYRPGSLRYVIRDPRLGDATLELGALALFDREAFVVEATLRGVAPAGIELVWAYGGANGQRGRRDGDIGTEDVPISQWFQLQPAFAQGNRFRVEGREFTLEGTRARVRGLGPEGARYEVADAVRWDTLEGLLASAAAGYNGNQPVLVGRAPLAAGAPLHLGWQRLLPATAGAGENTSSGELATYVEAGGHATVPAEARAPVATVVPIPPPPAHGPLAADELAAAWTAAERYRSALATQVVVETPDPFINAAVAALNVAAEGVWDEASGTVQHGAVAWRSRLLGWRGAYALDALGWHQRARRHLTYWPTRQITAPIPDQIPPADAEANLSRAEAALHSNGAMSTGHYDMNLVYIDALFRHLRWTGDLALARDLWPTIERHLAWEHRLFRRPYPGSGDGAETLPLYEAYAAIWASDDLFYSGGGATHATAYNLWHHQEAARLASLLGVAGARYAEEAALIRRGLTRELWMADRGSYAEWRDWLGRREAHESAAAWTFYHAVDSGATTPFEAWQMSRTMDTHVAHFPLRGPGVPDGFHTRPTTNWMPYMWSINNVVMGEVTHTALAYWQAGRPDAAWRLWKGAVLDSMFMGICPGNVGTTTAFDMARNESQRDFADPGGVLARSLVEGLFGVVPDALAGELTVRPGWPAAWPQARLQHPRVGLAYSRTGDAGPGGTERWEIQPRFDAPQRLRLQVAARGDQVARLLVNGGPAAWRALPDAIGAPRIEIVAPAAAAFQVELTWAGTAPAAAPAERIVARGEAVTLPPPGASGATAGAVFDPQGVLVAGRASGTVGHRTLFVAVAQGALRWWQPVALELREPLVLVAPADQPSGALEFSLQNNTATAVAGVATVRVAGHTHTLALEVPPRGVSTPLTLDATGLLPGTQRVDLTLADGRTVRGEVVNWKRTAPATAPAWEPVPLVAHFNSRVTEIFRQEYLAPRSPFTSLSMPKQGVGSWCKPLTEFAVDDRGLRAIAAAQDGRLVLPAGVPLATPGADATPNILFTTLWDNFPDAATVPLQGRAQHLYLLMAGSTHAMQSQFDNGEVVVRYTDGTTERLALRNPTTWWPIEQDYVIDDFAFRRPEPIPPRVDLATGTVRVLDHAAVRGQGLKKIKGGSATVLDLPLDPAKDLESLTVRTLANEVVIGLMAATLVR